jgi:hypothetical protein
MIRSCISLVFAVLLAGCAVAAAPAAQPTQQVVSVSPAPFASVMAPASVAPAASPSTPPTQDEIRLVAGKAYLAPVTPANKAFTALWKIYKNKTSLKANRQYCTKLATVMRAELLALQAIEYPEDTTADAKALIRADAASEADLRTCAKASNFTAWNRAMSLADKASDRAHEAANLIRLDLGLPPVPG